MSSNSSTGSSLLTPATGVEFFAKAEPAEWLSEGECDFAKTSKPSAATTNPKFNRRFMETPVWLNTTLSPAPLDYGQRAAGDVICLTYHELLADGN